jgi:hypothetical protein
VTGVQTCALPILDGISWTSQSKFKVDFCAGIGDSEMILASSNPVKLPELPDRAGKPESAFNGNRLLRLSGYGDYRILQRIERQSRAKGVTIDN